MTSIDDYRWVVSDAAEKWLAQVREEMGAAPLSAALITRLRKELSADRAHLVVEQVELRRRACEKFSHAEQMFFTRKGLEQATDEQVAAVKAARFPSDRPITDLCCGIGGDLLALAGRGAAFGYDLDEVAVLLATVNARAWGYSGKQCGAVAGDAAEVSVADGPWHIDPDRRASGRRTTMAEFFDPPLPSLEHKLGDNMNAAIKLAPATDVPTHWQSQAERQWLGSRGECRQQVAWFGSLARHPGMHSATVVDAPGGEQTIVGKPDEPIPVAESLGPLLYEPHAAVLAAKLTGAVCREHSLAAVSPGVAYLTAAPPRGESSTGKDSRPLCTAFEILEVLPLDIKQLKAWCRERRIGRLVIKKRGVDVDPNKLWKAIVGQGDEEALFIVTPIRGHVRVVVARRVSPPPSADLAG